MYKCIECGEIFDEPEKVRFELFRIDGVPQYGYDHACPCCGRVDEMEMVDKCDECGEYFRKDELITTDEGTFCLDCSEIEYNPFRRMNTAMEELL